MRRGNGWRGKLGSLDYRITLPRQARPAPTTSAVKGSDLCRLVTEPTPLGLNNLEIAAEAVRKMEIPFAPIINRWNGDTVFEKSLEERNIPVLGKLPFNRKLAEAYSRGTTAVEVSPDYAEFFAGIIEKNTHLLETK